MIPSQGPVVFVGTATLDTIALVAHLPAADDRIVADDIAYAGGGPAATAAVTAARLGTPEVAFVGSVGRDDEGRRIVAGLVAEGVDVSGVRYRSGGRSGTSVVVVDRGSGTRTICTLPAPVPVVDDDAPVRKLIRAASWVHVDHLGWGPVAALMASDRSCVTRLSVDAGNPIAGVRAAGVDLHVPTLTWLQHRHGPAEPELLLRRALEDGAAAVVATLGAEGCIAGTATGERYYAPGVPVAVCSTLGAGDVFHGALLSAVVRGDPLPDAMAYANTVAALSCRGLDGRSAIPTHAVALGYLSATAPRSQEHQGRPPAPTPRRPCAVIPAPSTCSPWTSARRCAPCSPNTRRAR